MRSVLDHGLPCSCLVLKGHTLKTVLLRFLVLVFVVSQYLLILYRIDFDNTGVTIIKLDPGIIGRLTAPDKRQVYSPYTSVLDIAPTGNHHVNNMLFSTGLGSTVKPQH